VALLVPDRHQPPVVEHEDIGASRIRRRE
jgi:hypothetical protein